LFEEQTRFMPASYVIAATVVHARWRLLDGVVARPHRRGATSRSPTPSPRRRLHAIAARPKPHTRRDAGFMNEEQKVKEKAKAMLDYFQTTYERDLFATRCQPPENMQRKSNKVLYDRMWGGSRSNMLHSVNKKNLGYPPTTETLRTQPLLDHLAATRSRDVAGDAARRAAALPAHVTA